MTITLTREEAQQVEQYIKPGAMVPVDMQTTRLLVNALRARLAQPEWGEDYRVMYLKVRDELAELQQREWQGLTETEKEMLWDEAVEGREHFCSQYGDFADAIEAKLKEKNT